MRHLTLVLVATLLVLVPLASADVAPTTRSAVVAAEVRTHDLVIRDEARQKDLPVEVTYPAALDGRHPVIIFCHGAGGSGDGVSGLTRFWASRGYVCLAPTHADSIRLRRQRGEEVGDNLGDAMNGTLRKVMTEPTFAANRVKDVVFLLDSFDAVEQKLPELKTHLDRDRVGVGGHSFGAHTAMLVGGAKRALAADAHATADPRPKAFLVVSGQGAGVGGGFDKHSWADFTGPMMVMTGSRDRGAQGQDPAWRREPYDLAPRGDKYLVWIDGAHHGSFTGRFAGEGTGAGIGRRALRASRLGDDVGGVGVTDAQKQIFADVKRTTLAFWDAHLRGDENAKADLTTNAIKDASAGRTTVLSK